MSKWSQNQNVIMECNSQLTSLSQSISSVGVNFLIILTTITRITVLWLYTVLVILNNTVVNLLFFRCGNVAAILELDEKLQKEFMIFEAAPQEDRGVPMKKPQADYFL